MAKWHHEHHLWHYPLNNNQVKYILVLNKTKSLESLLLTVYQNIVKLLKITKDKADPQLLWI